MHDASRLEEHLRRQEQRRAEHATRWEARMARHEQRRAERRADLEQRLQAGEQRRSERRADWHARWVEHQARCDEFSTQRGWRRACIWRGKLYLRIWCAMLASLVLAGVLTALSWRLISSDWRTNELSLSTPQGQVVGLAQLQPDEEAGHGVFRVTMPDGTRYVASWTKPDKLTEMSLRLLSAIAMIILAVGIVAYPMAKRMTWRIIAMRRSMDAFGEGDLSARIPVRGHDEIAHLAAGFNLAAERIEALMRTQKSLLANASHELRSPLARIRMSLGLLGDACEGPARVELERSVGELDALVEEILISSRLDAPNGQGEVCEEIDLTGLAAEECARVDAELHPEHVVLQGSARLLRRMLRNLLENARRHGQGAPISAQLKRDGEMIEIRVCDRGPGVPEDQRERIFEPFYRTPGASEKSGGVGLGLALVRSIARHHGGEVHCIDHEGGGACFVVRLPAKA
ncbi:ATP-binding protein [Niveibacterium sp. SC-1]|uniref:ATP-binding protein n=1 Tax=Niveibacterium sp. SC-1 TaxID=3135646 RepID=UPI00312032F4